MAPRPTIQLGAHARLLLLGAGVTLGCARGEAATTTAAPSGRAATPEERAILDRQRAADAQLDAAWSIAVEDPSVALETASELAEDPELTGPQRQAAARLADTARTLLTPVPDDATAEGEPAPAPLDRAVLECEAVGDDACLVHLLEGRADTEGQLATLIEAYRARSQEERAREQMGRYLELYPDTARANVYRRILAPPS